MVETAILTYLKGAMNLPCYMEHPEPEPPEYFTIEKTGGGQNGRLYNSTIAVQCYADSLFRAAEMCADLVAAMENASTIKNLSAVELNSCYNFTDTATKKYRYQAVFDLRHNNLI